MIYSLLKAAFYGFAWIAPIVVLFGVSRVLQNRSTSASKQKVVVLILIPVVWTIGLIGCLLAHSFHEASWHSNNPQGIVTEEDMIALGDYPNVFAGWVLLGWFPVALGLILARRQRRKIQAQQVGDGDVSQRPC